jgi:hypothetical protein
MNQHVHPTDQPCPDCQKAAALAAERFHPDPSIPIDNQGLTFLHCRKCVEELRRGGSPRDYARLSIAITSRGLQVWCNRHNCNVGHFDLGEAPVRVNGASE